MKEFLKNNFAVVIAFLLPLLLILIVALSIYIPSLLVHTNYNFVYASCTESSNYYYYDCNSYLAKRYSVVGGKLTVNEVPPVKDAYGKDLPESQRNYSSHIFIHNTKNNESREISLDEAKNLNLSNLLTSPDGVTVSSNYTSGGDYFFPFGGSSSSYGYYLMKGKGKSKLNLINSSDRYYYQNNFQFIGWTL